MTPGVVPLDPARRCADAEEFEEQLRSRVVGQNEAIAVVSEALALDRAGLGHPGRPLSTLLFLGPTGTGKTRLVEAVGEVLHGEEGRFLKIDCAEFSENHEIAKLIGSPPGYIGHEKTKPRLNQRALDEQHSKDAKVSILLLDEIEKASSALWNLLLGILDKAILSLGDNSTVNFARTIVIMTSNLGARQVQDLLAGGVGFRFPALSEEEDNKLGDKIKKTSRLAANRRFNPEFMNRIDHVVTFHSLTKEDTEKVLDIELRKVVERILKADTHKKFTFECDLKARAFLIAEGFDRKYGARQLKRAIDRHLVTRLSHFILTGQVSLGDLVLVSADDQGLTFSNVQGNAVLALPGAPWIAPAVENLQ